MSTAAKASGLLVMGGEARDALFDLRWMLALIAVMIIADFWFGVADSVNKRGEDFHFSRAGRRTLGKATEYVMYLVVGSILGKAIFEPMGICSHVVVAAVALSFAVLWEADSIIEHVCSLHNITTRFSVKRFILALIKRKSPAVGEALEETLEEAEKEDGKKGK